MTWRPVIKPTSTTISLLVIAIILGIVYLDLQNSSPGGLTAVHARDARLTGSQSCQACHGAPGQSLAAACLRCHVDITTQLSSADGLHGQLPDSSAKDCAHCHSEHHGAGFAITSDRSFARAGIARRSQYDHANVAFRLTGRHTGIRCEGCHPNATVPLLPEGEHRYLGLDQNCTTCHDDVHRGAYGSDCASCHGQQAPFEEVAAFEHSSVFPLSGAHAEAACVDCHAPDTPYAIGNLPSTSPSAFATRTCGNCHASPHQESFLTGIARQSQVDKDRSCQLCHSEDRDAFQGPRASLSVSQHACTGFALETPHDKAACAGCHPGYGRTKRDLAEFQDAYRRRHPDDCRSCHDDPHQGQFALGTLRGADCLTCHFRDTFIPSAFTSTQHIHTRFPLAGAHCRIHCNQCHMTADQLAGNSQEVLSGEVAENSVRSGVRIFHGTPTQCKACHEDPHAGQFDRGPYRGHDCLSCHNQDTFRNPTYTIAQHADTSFPLTGAHEAVACTACHKPPAETPWTARLQSQVPLVGFARREPHRPGGQNQPLNLDGSRPTGHRGQVASRIFRGTPTQCKRCHVDAHEGRFDAPLMPATIEGRAGCARCHTTDSFETIRLATFDHALWTGFALRGAHRLASCKDCHARGPAADGSGSAFQRTFDRHCQACHSDPHVGQFGPTPRVNCTACHRDGDSFSELVFDHQEHSRFQLDSDHATLACAACHKPQELPAGGTAVRYKPLGTQCGDCHTPRGTRRAHPGNRP